MCIEESCGRQYADEDTDHDTCPDRHADAIDTVNRELGLSVNRYCAINVDSFSGIIDSLGGVSITLTDDEAEALALEKGTQMLSGTDAVRYLKLRRQWDGALRFRILLEGVRFMYADMEEFAGDAYMRKVRERMGDALLPIAELEERCGELGLRSPLVVGDIAEAVCGALRDGEACPEELRFVHAGQAGLAAFRRIAEGKTCSAAELAPFYLQPSQAERNRQEKENGR